MKRLSLLLNDKHLMARKRPNRQYRIKTISLQILLEEKNPEPSHRYLSSLYIISIVIKLRTLQIRDNRNLNPTTQSPSFQLWAKYWRNCFWNTQPPPQKNNLQHPHQHGFRTNRSTEEAILDLLDKINSAENSNQHALMIS
ncbi:hypothetical protein AVEN_179361-1 [Araneus ventricosus]|uniref:Uncharacterized protein n=1 Tax=Araneus ventricosus TaxID=182803 RepID=A0A4Y2H0Z4_ARAVE|nr:hypothetical protein AVEN_179361-1 [Araneus ventricosus]